MHPVKVVYRTEARAFEIMVGVVDSIIWHVPVRAEPVHVIGKLLLILETFPVEQKTEIEVVYLLHVFLRFVCPLTHCNCDDVAKSVHMHGTNITNAMLIPAFRVKLE